MLHFLCTGACVRACTWLVKSWIPHCTDESMMGNCSHVVFQKNKIYQNIFNPLSCNNVERIRDHPCPLMTPVLTRRLQASPAHRWSAAILKVEGASIDTSRPEISNQKVSTGSHACTYPSSMQEDLCSTSAHPYCAPCQFFCAAILLGQKECLVFEILKQTN